MKNMALYIHIPFCESKCYYCDFNSYVNRIDLEDKYVEYLIKELILYSDNLEDFNIETIFIGGGTPSLLSKKSISKIFNVIHKNYSMKELSEISIEANPNSLSLDKLLHYKDVGINRISLGVQSLNENLIRSIGRIHTTEDFFNTYNNIRKVGFNNVNVDVMFNLPNQKNKDLLDTLNKIIKLDVEHISLYSLKIEENTPFYTMYSSGDLLLPHEDIERDMYYSSIYLLQQNDYKQYEISNFSKKGYECKHNLFYWKVKPYLGIGLGAHSNLLHKRWGNVINFDDYFKKIDENNYPREDIEDIDLLTEVFEYTILGLRLNVGINKLNFKKRFGKNIETIYKSELNKLEKDKLILIDENRIYLTEKGKDLSNIVFQEFMK